jgi:transcriptional regulator with XRE-family HTH domain
LEKGKKKNPSILVIKRIAQALKVDASELLK